VAVALPAGGSAAKSFPTTGPGLQPIGCVKDPSRDANCTQSMNGVLEVEEFAESPGGDTLYAAAFDSHAVSWLGRASGGSLTPGSCIDDGTTGACPASFGPIGGPSAVAVAGDSAYSTGFSAGEMVQFVRGGDGSLTPTGCFGAFSASCTGVPGLVEATDVVISPDGSSVYVSDDLSSAIYRFNRAPDGSLTYAGCVSDNAGGEPSCAQKVDGLGGAFAMDITQDGQSLYVIGGSLVHFNRAADGSLSYGGCIKDAGSGASCAQSAEAMSVPFDVAASPDGSSVYVVSFSSEAIARFDRAPDGSLTPAGCVAGTKGAEACVAAGFSMKGAWAVDVSPDSRSVYMTAQTGDALISFLRGPDGALTPAGCVLATDTDKGFSGDVSAAAKEKSGACAILAEGLEDPRAVYASADGNNVYVGSDQGAIAAFRRDIQPPSTKLKGPKTTSSNKPKLKLKSDEPGSTFLCAVDKKNPKPCGAKFKPKLGDGKHTITAIAVDAAGNPDPTPAKKKVKVVD
jgi:DNA-binding beta-propeller fold protein YncE